MNTYHLDKKTNEIVFKNKLRKCRNGIKVFFYRGKIDERTMDTYPVAYADAPNDNRISWIEGMEILGLAIKIPIFFGLFGYRWEMLEEKKYE